MANLENRIKYLETAMRSQRAAGIWVDMNDNRARVDLAGKRGEEMIFPSVAACAVWVEKQMKQSENVTGMAFITDISQLYPDEELQKDFLEALGGELEGVLMNLAGSGKNNLVDMALATSVFYCFNNSGFHGRFKNDEFTDQDNRFFYALFLLYCQARPGDLESQINGYAQLILQAGKVPTLPQILSN